MKIFPPELSVFTSMSAWTSRSISDISFVRRRLRIKAKKKPPSKALGTGPYRSLPASKPHRDPLEILEGLKVNISYRSYLNKKNCWHGRLQDPAVSPTTGVHLIIEAEADSLENLATQLHTEYENLRAYGYNHPGHPHV